MHNKLFRSVFRNGDLFSEVERLITRLPATEVAAESVKAVLAKSGCLQEVLSQCGSFIPSTLCTTPTGRRCTSLQSSRIAASQHDSLHFSRVFHSPVSWRSLLRLSGKEMRVA